MAAAWVVLQLGWIEPTASSIPLVKIGLALLLPNVLVSVLAGSLQALHHALLAEVLSSMLRTVLMLLGLAALWPAAGTWLSPAVVMDLYLAVSVLLLLIASALTYQLQRRAIPQVAPGYAPRPWKQAAVGVLAVLLVATGQRTPGPVAARLASPGVFCRRLCRRSAVFTNRADGGECNHHRHGAAIRGVLACAARRQYTTGSRGRRT